MIFGTRVIRLAAIFGIAAMLVGLGFATSALYWHGPSSVDLDPFDWDGMSAVMSFVSAVATFAAVVAALKIAGNESIERSQRTEHATAIVVRIVFVEIIALRHHLRELRKVFRTSSNASTETCARIFVDLEKQISIALAQPATESIREQLLVIRGEIGEVIAQSYSITQQIRDHASTVARAEKKPENWGRTTFDALRMLTISAQEVCNVAFANCWQIASEDKEIPDKADHEICDVDREFQRTHRRRKQEEASVRANALNNADS